jgi:hypothetical protein
VPPMPLMSAAIQDHLLKRTELALLQPRPKRKTVQSLPRPAQPVADLLD